MAPARANSRLGLILVLAAVVAGCASEFERRYDEAESLRQQAAERGYEWIDTAALLEEAEALAAGGDVESALELVAKARFQAAAALAQADAEAEAWKHRVPE